MNGLQANAVGDRRADYDTRVVRRMGFPFAGGQALRPGLEHLPTRATVLRQRAQRHDQANSVVHPSLARSGSYRGGEPRRWAIKDPWHSAHQQGSIARLSNRILSRCRHPAPNSGRKTSGDRTPNNGEQCNCGSLSSGEEGRFTTVEARLPKFRTNHRKITSGDSLQTSALPEFQQNSGSIRGVLCQNSGSHIGLPTLRSLRNRSLRDRSDARANRRSPPPRLEKLSGPPSLKITAGCQRRAEFDSFRAFRERHRVARGHRNGHGHPHG
jgi:hypothetical protein